MRIRFTLGLLMAAAGAAQAQTVNGLYIGAGIGGTMLNSTINRRTPVGFSGQGAGSEFTYRTGIAGHGAVGWGFGNGFRAELEGYFRQPGIDNVTLFGNPNPATNNNNNNNNAAALVMRGGRAQVYGFMANAYYDFDLTALSPVFRYVQPYVGAGVGFAYSEFRDFRADAVGGQRTTLEGTGRTVGYQGMVGANVPLDTVVPGLSLTAEYRYFGAGAPRLTVQSGNVQNNNNNNQFNQFNQQNQQNQPTRSVSPGIGSHNFTLGLRYAFNTPSSAPVAAPVALGFALPQFAPRQQAQNFAVYFPLSSSNLDGAARGTVSQAAQTARSAGASGLDVVGSADGAMNASNRALSSRRAQVVVAELVRQGIPRSAISVSSVGGTGPVEAQSRRVDIILR